MIDSTLLRETEQMFKDRTALQCPARKELLDFLASSPPEKHRKAEAVYSAMNTPLVNGHVNLSYELGRYEQFAQWTGAFFRQHFVHSIYVYILGLLIYHKTFSIRDAFQDESKTRDQQFCYYWAMTALFHDCAYPIDICFNSLARYLEYVLQADAPKLFRVQDAHALLRHTMIIDTNENRPILEPGLAMLCRYLVNQQIFACTAQRAEQLVCECIERSCEEGKWDHGIWGALFLLKQWATPGSEVQHRHWMRIAT